MDLLTLAAAKRYTNEKTGSDSDYELIEQLPISEDVNNIRKIELVPADESESGETEIRIYGIKQ